MPNMAHIIGVANIMHASDNHVVNNERWPMSDSVVWQRINSLRLSLFENTMTRLQRFRPTMLLIAPLCVSSNNVTEANELLSNTRQHIHCADDKSSHHNDEYSCSITSGYNRSAFIESNTMLTFTPLYRPIYPSPTSPEGQHHHAHL